MHVMLISRCTGRARRRSASLLDSYAIRTGDATWSTPITTEALGELRAALRRSASRHTCVGCYVSVGRARLRLAWTVGRAGEFEPSGATPVGWTRRSRRLQVPVWMRRMALLAAAAGLAHDLGKATRLFQAKLRHNRREADPVRHEWLSMQVRRRLREGLGWKSAWALGGFKGAAMQQLPPFLKQGIRCGMDAVDFLVVSHHGLLGPDKESSQAWNPKPESGLHIRDDVPADRRAASSFEPEARLDARILAAMENAERRLVAIQSGDDSPSCWWSSAFFARAALIFADHVVSAGWPNKRELAKTEGRLYANTDPATRRLKQPLPWHLNAVGTLAADVCQKMMGLQLEGLSPQSVDAILDPIQAAGRFTWQQQATDALASLRERTQAPVLVFNMAGTGAGKTRMNARAACALACGPVRFSIVLNLRALTLQTGDALRSQWGMGSDEMAVVIGHPVIRKLHGSVREGPLDPDENPAVDEFGATSGRFVLPGWLAPWVEKHRSQEQLLGAPLLVSTIDYLVAAGEPHRQQHHVNALLRLLSGSDLVIDEIDGYDPASMVAVLRLVQVAALCGRNVIASSATLACPVADAVQAAFRAGTEARRAMTGRTLGAEVVLVDDVQAPRVVSAPERFSAEYRQHVEGILRQLDGKPVHRLAEVHPVWNRQWNMVGQLPTVAVRAETWLGQIRKSIRKLHADHSWPLGRHGVSISFGLVRVANIRQAVLVARDLAQKLPVAGLVAKVACYHSQDLLMQRHLKEQRLDFLLQRAMGDEHILNDAEIAAVAEACPGNDLVFVVVATPVEEIGRDHDFDWAVLEVSSAHSVVQTSGRVNRHRLRVIEKPNIAVLDMNFKTVSSARDADGMAMERWPHPVFVNPGLERQDRLYGINEKVRTVSAWELLSKHFVVDARLRFRSEEYRLARLDDESIATSIAGPLALVVSVAESPSPSLMTQAFYEHFPLRDDKARQTLRLVGEGEWTVFERREWTVDGWKWQKRGIGMPLPRHPNDWLVWDPDDLAQACKEHGIEPELGLTVETRWYDTEHLSRLLWDQSFGLCEVAPELRPLVTEAPGA